MRDYEKKTEELLLQMTKKEEEQNKKLLFSMYVIIITSAIFYILTLLIAVNFIQEGLKLGIIIVVATIVFLIAGFTALKIEVDAGYYECKKCHHKFVPTYKQVLMAMHIGTTRYLKCPKCNKRSWAKKVMSK